MNWFFELDTFNKLFLLTVLLFTVCWMSDCFIIPYFKNRHPKFRMNQAGYIEYYSLYYNCWRIFYFWDENSANRVLHMVDNIRDIEYDLEYKGPGRCMIQYNKQNFDFYCSKYRKVKDIDKYQNDLIDEENNYLVKNILNRKG